MSGDCVNDRRNFGGMHVDRDDGSDEYSEPNSSRLASPMATPRRSGITALLPCMPASSSAADAGPQPPWPASWLVSALRCLQPCNDPQMRYAIRRDDAEALVALLNSRRCFGIGRTDVNVALDGADGSALHLAASDASASMVRALLEHGALVHARNTAGETALHVAAKVPVFY